MIGGTPDPRFHPRAMRVSVATAALLAVAFPVAANANISPNPLSGYALKQQHRLHHQHPGLMRPNPLSGYQHRNGT